jgi:PTS system nitrogen regulatory IIA component
MKISNYLCDELVCFLKETSKDEVLKKLIQASLRAKKLSDEKPFATAIFEREKIVSTGIGMGVAIPHAKLDDLSEFFIVIGILERGVDWHALDGAPVRLIFMIGGPDDRQTEYLQILSTITQIVRDEALRRDLFSAQNGQEVIKLLEGS